MLTQQDVARRARVALILRAVGHDVTAGNDELHHWWTKGPGLKRWAESPTPWRTLVAQLARHVGMRKAKIYASRWVIEVFGMATGDDRYRLAHGGKIRGKRIGPG